MAISVRTATAGDVGALMGLYAQLHPNDPPVPEETARAVWERIAAQDGRTILVAEHEDAVVGTVDCTVLPNLTRAARPFMLVENVVVAGEMRRRGVGRALFEAVVEIARQTDCYKVQLLTASRRDSAHAFYEAQGLRPMAQGFRLYL